MGVKVLTVIGTRPEAIKLFPLIHALEADPRFQSLVCVTGQHREMVDEVLAFASIQRTHDLGSVEQGSSLDALTASVVTGVGTVLTGERPDWVVVQGDTTSAMAGALAAHHRQIPVCHVEAGLRTGDLTSPWPEEGNRRIIGSIATVHCAPTTTAVDALLRENIRAQDIHHTGNTVIDALAWTSARLRSDPGLAPSMQRLLALLEGRKIVLITCHRRENWTEIAGIAAALEQIARQDNLALVLPCHPNPAVRAQLAHLQRQNIALLPPLEYPEFVYLLANASLVLTDSGGVLEEATTLGTPVLVLRRTTERPEAFMNGGAKLVGTRPDQIIEAVEKAVRNLAQPGLTPGNESFGDGSAALRIRDLLARNSTPRVESLTSYRAADGCGLHTPCQPTPVPQ